MSEATAKTTWRPRSVTAGGGISLEKLDDGMSTTGKAMPFSGVDDRFAVFVGKCAKSKAPYVLKYEKHMGRFDTSTRS